jgi:hypothetical protein
MLIIRRPLQAVSCNQNTCFQVDKSPHSRFSDGRREGTPVLCIFYTVAVERSPMNGGEVGLDVFLFLPAAVPS